MAEALGRHIFGKEIYFASAGVKRGQTDGFTIAAMEELGIDLTKHRPIPLRISKTPASTSS